MEGIELDRHGRTSSVVRAPAWSMAEPDTLPSTATQCKL
jgi:hypothetical protein